MTDPIPRRRFSPTPAWLIYGLLVVEGLLWLSERLQWPTWHKGYAVLTAVAAVGGVFVLMLLWFIASLLFRWRFQFSIRSLLVLTVAVALPCSWLGVEIDEARQEQEAETAIRNLGGWAEWSEPSGPVWLRGLLGDYFFEQIESVHLDGIEFTDAQGRHIHGLDRLKELNLNFVQNADAWLEHFTKLHDLQYLALVHANFTDTGLAHLNDLNHLRVLHLDVTHVTDAELEKLMGLNQLQELGLILTPVTDAGLTYLSELKQLQKLSLGGTKVTKDGVEKLQRALPNCVIVL